MTRKSARKYRQWVIRPLTDPLRGANILLDHASPDLILEELRRESELADIGRKLFAGPLPRKNRLWREYRNFARQAESNFITGLGAPDRSACLLFYYAKLNWAKAELLMSRPNDIVDRKVTHGVSFDPTTAGTIRGDYLTVRRDGVFPWLYERRVGASIAAGTKLPIKRLLLQIPEIGSQVSAVSLGPSQPSGAFQLVCHDGSEAWSFVVIQTGGITSSRATWTAIRSSFEEVSPSADWRDHLGISRRASLGEVKFLQLRNKVQMRNSDDGSDANVDLALHEAQRRTHAALAPWLDVTTEPAFDGTLYPSLYKSRQLLMPASLARYLVMFYASSLVRYRPAMFDPQLHPDQALLFDAIARECAVPLLQDTLSSLRGRPHIFMPLTYWRS